MSYEWWWRAGARVGGVGAAWVSEAPQVAELARRFPEVPIVMTNGGQINISGFSQRNSRLALAECANASMTTSGVYREDFIEDVLESRSGTTRCSSGARARSSIRTSSCIASSGHTWRRL
jgi:hypothetical protein